MKNSIIGRSAPFRPYISADGGFNRSFREETAVIDGALGRSVIRKTRFVVKNIDDVADEHPLPTSEEYSLEGLLASGAPLKQIDCEHLLESHDILDLEGMGVSQNLIMQLREIEARQSEIEVRQSDNVDNSPSLESEQKEITETKEITND